MSGSLVFTTINDSADPTASTQLYSVNDSGIIVGSVFGGMGAYGFVAGPSFQDTFSVPLGFDPVAFGINNSGEIVGSYLNGAGQSIAFSTELNNLNGAAAIADVPVNATAYGVDANGDVLGIVTNGASISGQEFMLSGGTFGLSTATNAVVDAISEDGFDTLAVFSNDGVSFQNLLEIFLHRGPLLLSNLPSSFEAQGVNDAGQVVGFDNGSPTGFFRDSDGTVYGIEIPGSFGTAAEGINDNGEIVGFYLGADGNNHGFTTTVADVVAADDVLEPPCYCAGTLIATDRGDVPVEYLKIGDNLVTGSGALRPIKWIGRRNYGGRFITGNKDILPVCIKAGALADNVPRRDLWISPHHAMQIDGLLIEGRDLVNGTSIFQAERVETVSYFHVELETHDVIVAEGALSETYMDEDNRGMFQNTHEYGALFPDAQALPAQYCARRVDDGYALEAVRNRLALRAGLNAPAGLQVRVFRRSAKSVSAA